MYLYVLNAFADIFEIVMFIIMSYYLATAFFSLLGGERNAKHSHIRKYLAVIPAKNEEANIVQIIQSIKNTDYPQDKISVLVIADECSDRTETNARKSGADVLVRRTSTTKGDALKDAFEYIMSEEYDCDFDCVAVFDSDNIIDENFFTEINERISLGDSVVQGYIDSKNPDASWVSYSYSVWYWITNRIIQSGRGKLNFGCRLGGTGFVLTREVLDRVKWNTSSLAEDMEYTYMLAENNIKVAYCEKAVVYDEKPISFSNSVGQRVRWAKGICDVQGEYTPRLIKKCKLNALFGLWSDVLVPLNYALLTLSFFLKIGNVWQTTFGALVLWICLFAYLLCMLLALVKDKKFGFKTIINIFGFLLYLAGWIPIGICGIFGKRNVWYQTKHESRP